MKFTQIYLFFVLCAILAYVIAEKTFSIESSNAPNLQYDVDAIECLREAYVLYPENMDDRNEAVAKLFNNKHSNKKGWNIAEGCISSYNPAATISIKILIEDSDDGTRSILKIYD
ncbi:uncharacterized protein LOC108904241 [Anoplophora glabripennis]|uniref:uncharacterized protein LOC108904241 n=1 Tax=Anoplophora glabripennis TaxID=217634 RepID=UPI0008746CD7|nr:uncharacterized protein LOC108904241 [Anoplophora glabripennis]